MQVILTQINMPAFANESASFDTSNPLELAAIAALMKLSMEEISHHLHENGEVTTSEFTLTVYQDPADLLTPERLEQATSALSFIVDLPGMESIDGFVEAFATINAALEFAAETLDGIAD